MKFEISLEHTIEFYRFARELLKTFDDYEFETQIEYFDELCSRDKVSSEDLMALLDVDIFWELWLNDVSDLKKYTTMAIELASYAQALGQYHATAKIKEEN